MRGSHRELPISDFATTKVDTVVTSIFHDQIVTLLSPAFLTKRPVDVDAIVHQLECDWPNTSTAKLRLAVASIAQDMRLRLKNSSS